MGEKPIDLEAIRRADAKLKQLLEAHPELREPNPERQAALEAWLEDHREEDEDHGEAWKTIRVSVGRREACHGLGASPA